MNLSARSAIVAVLFALVWLSSASLIQAAPAENAGLTAPEIQKLYIDYLSDEGFKAELDTDGDVKFKREGKTYFLQVSEKDPEFFRLVFPNFWKIEDTQERAKVLSAADSANAATKCFKVFTVKDNVWASIEAFLPKLEDFRLIFPRSMSAMQTGVGNFRAKMQEKD